METVQKPKRSAKEWLVRIAILYVGLIIAHFGIALFVVPSLGTDCFTIFAQGISTKINTTVGVAHMVTLSVFTIVMLITSKGYLKLGSIVCVFCSGPIIDFFIALNNNRICETSPLFVRIVSMLLGVLFLSIGLSFIINSDAGAGPNDLVALILHDKFPKFEFRYTRIFCDFIYVAIGTILGGTLGIGTLCAATLVGPIAQFFLPKSKKITDYILARYSLN